jgi:hypothetical protein
VWNVYLIVWKPVLLCNKITTKELFDFSSFFHTVIMPGYWRDVVNSVYWGHHYGLVHQRYPEDQNKPQKNIDLEQDLDNVYEVIDEVNMEAVGMMEEKNKGKKGVMLKKFQQQSKMDPETAQSDTSHQDSLSCNAYLDPGINQNQKEQARLPEIKYQQEHSNTDVKKNEIGDQSVFVCRVRASVRITSWFTLSYGEKKKWKRKSRIEEVIEDTSLAQQLESEHKQSSTN